MARVPASQPGDPFQLEKDTETGVLYDPADTPNIDSQTKEMVGQSLKDTHLMVQDKDGQYNYIDPTPRGPDGTKLELPTIESYTGPRPGETFVADGFDETPKFTNQTELDHYLKTNPDFAKDHPEATLENINNIFNIDDTEYDSQLKKGVQEGHVDVEALINSYINNDEQMPNWLEVIYKKGGITRGTHLRKQIGRPDEMKKAPIAFEHVFQPPKFDPKNFMPNRRTPGYEVQDAFNRNSR